MDKARC